MTAGLSRPGIFSKHHVVDQSRAPEVCGDGDEQATRRLQRREQGLRVDDRNVVHTLEPRPDRLLRQCAKPSWISFPVLPGIVGGPKTRYDSECPLAFRWAGYRLREERASPSGSRTIGQPTTSTGMSRSLAILERILHCWKSLRPKTAVQGPVRLNSLATTVVTPAK